MTKTLIRICLLLNLTLLVPLPEAGAVERLDRGVAAFTRSDGSVYIGWRLLVSDPPNVTFDIYRSETPRGPRAKINPSPIGDSTNFVDRNVGGKKFFYAIRALAKGKTLNDSDPVGADEQTSVGGVPRIKFQGDYKAEVYCKAGPPGDPRDERGLVTSGPEYLVKLDGETGKALARLDWPDRSGITKNNSDTPEYNFWSRNLLAVAYLDGKRPHLIVERGAYTRIKIRAYDQQLKLVWSLETKGEYEAYKGQCTHGMQVADIDEDGRDELVIGAAAIDDNGKPLWTTGRGHPDICHVGDIDPSRPGLEIVYGHEWAQEKNGICLVEARTGALIWGINSPTKHIHSQGLVADIDPTRPGMEIYGGEKRHPEFYLFDVKGNLMSDKSFGTLAPTPVWWADKAHKLIVANGKMFVFNGPELGEVKGALAFHTAGGGTTQIFINDFDLFPT